MSRAIETYRGVAYPWFCDSMGHMNTQFYAMMYDAASFHFLSQIAPSAELQRLGRGWADVRQTIEYKREVRAGSLLVIRTHLARLGGKSVTFVHVMSNAEAGELHSTCENVTALFDLVARAAVPLDEPMRVRAAEQGLL